MAAEKSEGDTATQPKSHGNAIIDQFVNQEDALERVSNLLVKAESKESIPNLVICTGTRGAGKSWLAYYLHHQLQVNQLNDEALQELEISSLLLIAHPMIDSPHIWRETIKNDSDSFSLRDDGRSWPPTIDGEESVSTICKKLSDRFSAIRSNNISLRVNQEYLFDAIKRYLQQDSKRRFIVIVDSVYEASGDLQRELESLLLVGVAQLPQTLVVLTGRGSPPSFTSSWLRIGPDNTLPLRSFVSGLDMPSFDYLEGTVDTQVAEILNYQHAEEQILRMGIKISSNAAKTIANLGGGFPLNTSHFARELIHNGQVVRDKPTVTEALFTLINLLIPAEENRSDHDWVREHLIPLSILNQFRAIDIVPLLDGYGIDDRWPRVSGLEIQQKLSATDLLYWKKSAWRIQPSIRYVMRMWLAMEKRDLWQELLSAKIDEYRMLATRYLKYEKQFQAEINSLEEQLQRYASFTDAILK